MHKGFVIGQEGTRAAFDEGLEAANGEVCGQEFAVEGVIFGLGVGEVLTEEG